MTTEKLICIVCPIGCHLEVDTSEDEYKVAGAVCKRGERYAIKKLKSPTRLLTTTVKTKDLKTKFIPVRTSKEIPKDKIFQCMKEINAIIVTRPVKMGDILIENILDTGVNIIASKSAE